MSKKISQLTAVVTPAGSDEVEVNQSGTSKRASVTQITSIEATARANADTTLQNNINAEATTRANADTALQTDIDNRIKKDGTVTFTANQPLGGFKFTGLGAGTTAGDSVRYEQAILVNGANNFTADQNMGGFKITGAANPTVDTDYVTLDFLKKNQKSWNFGSNAVTKSLNSSFTVTSGTDKNIIRLTGSQNITANRTHTLAFGTNDDDNFTLIFQQFKVDAGVTLTITDGSQTTTYEAGTHPPHIVEYRDAQYWKYPVTLDVSGAKLGVDYKWYKATYDFDDVGGAISTINCKDILGNDVVLPEGSILLRNQVIIEVETQFTSGGAATVAWGYTGTTNAFDAATGYGSAPYTAANSVDLGSVTTVTKLTSASTITMTIAGAALTAGKAHIYIPVILNKF